MLLNDRAGGIAQSLDGSLVICAASNERHRHEKQQDDTGGEELNAAVCQLSDQEANKTGNDHDLSRVSIDPWHSVWEERCEHTSGAEDVLSERSLSCEQAADRRNTDGRDGWIDVGHALQLVSISVAHTSLNQGLGDALEILRLLLRRSDQFLVAVRHVLHR